MSVDAMNVPDQPEVLDVDSQQSNQPSTAVDLGPVAGPRGSSEYLDAK